MAAGDDFSRPTAIRHQVIAWATLMSLLLYLDRFCISICTNYIRQDLSVDPLLIGRLSTAFFFAYALGQVPAGWLTDRFGVRLMLSIFILGWSAFTGLQAFAQSFLLLGLLQLGCGLMQAGAYPAGARLVRDWNPPTTRGFGSAMVALGGRVGGAMAPILTAMMLVMFVPTSVSSLVTPKTYLNGPGLAKRWLPKAEPTQNPRPVDRQLEHLWSLLTADEQALISELGHIDETSAAAAMQSPLTEQNRRLRDVLNRLIELPTLAPAELYDLTIEREGRHLLEERQRLHIEGKTMSEEKLRRLNRLALESTFGKELGNVYVSGWRPSMLVYGVIGIVIAGLFFWQVRNRPADDPRTNSAERALAQVDTPSATAKLADHEPFPWLPMLTNISLWGNCLLQITTNIGWVFLVRTMPQYLEEVHNVPLVMRGWMTSVPIWAGVVGVYFGGRLTDSLGQRLGLRWGRRLPLLVTRFTAGMGYVICIALSYLVPADQAPSWMPWVYVAALCLVAISTDIGVPANWAYMQDVGGKHTAAVLGWGNMWGNLGAAAATEIYARILGKSAGLAEWNLLFITLAGVFALGAVGAMLMDASKPLSPVRTDE